MLSSAWLASFHSDPYTMKPPAVSRLLRVFMAAGGFLFLTIAVAPGQQAVDDDQTQALLVEISGKLDQVSTDLETLDDRGEEIIAYLCGCCIAGLLAYAVDSVMPRER